MIGWFCFWTSGMFTLRIAFPRILKTTPSQDRPDSWHSVPCLPVIPNYIWTPWVQSGTHWIDFSGNRCRYGHRGVVTAILELVVNYRFPFVVELTSPHRLGRKEIQKHGSIRPEFRLIMGQVGAILIPISLFWIAFTTYRSVHWILPIIGSIPFGMGISYAFSSTFTYLITAYRPIAASVLASNSFARSCFACAFPLFTSAMYNALGTVGATALCAGLATLFAPLP